MTEYRHAILVPVAFVVACPHCAALAPRTHVRRRAPRPRQRRRRVLSYLQALAPTWWTRPLYKSLMYQRASRDEPIKTMLCPKCHLAFALTDNRDVWMGLAIHPDTMEIPDDAQPHPTAPWNPSDFRDDY